MWGEIKTAINSTTGAGMLPLDKIIVEESTEVIYNIMADKYGAKYVYETTDFVAVIPREYETTGGISGLGMYNIVDMYFSPETKTIKAGFATGIPLANVYIPCVEVVQANAFRNCTIKTVVLGSSLKRLGLWAFGNPVGTVFFKGTKKQWELVEKDKAWNREIKAKIVCYDAVFED